MNNKALPDETVKEYGFTLVELLIGINLAFIAVSLIISFYLFTAKFAGSVSKSLNDKEMISDSIMKLQDLIRKKREFSITGEIDGAVYFIFEKTDTVSFKQDSFRMVNYYSLGKLEDYSIRLLLYGGREVVLRKDSKPDPAEYPAEGYSSKIISEITLTIIKDKNTCSFVLVKPPTSENQFRDIGPK